MVNSHFSAIVKPHLKFDVKFWHTFYQGGQLCRIQCFLFLVKSVHRAHYMC